MPTLIRMLVSLLVIVAAVYAAMFALAYLVEPTQKEITVEIPAGRLKPAP